MHLKSPREGVKGLVTPAMIRPIHGITKLEWYDINTGEMPDPASTERFSSHATGEPDPRIQSAGQKYILL